MNLREYVRDGPSAGGDDIPKRALGCLLHWRLWAAFAVAIASIFAAGYATQNYGAAWGTVWFLGLYTGMICEKVSES